MGLYVEAFRIFIAHSTKHLCQRLIFIVDNFIERRVHIEQHDLPLPHTDQLQKEPLLIVLADILR